MSQSVLSRALWWSFCVCGVWNNAVCYLCRGIFIAAIIQDLQSSCLHSYVQKRRYSVWRNIRNCLYINQHPIMKIYTHGNIKNAQLIRNATCKAVEKSRYTVNKSWGFQALQTLICFDKVFHSAFGSTLQVSVTKCVKETRKTARKSVQIETIKYMSPVLYSPALTWNTGWAEQRQRACLLQAWRKTEREYVTILK